MITKLAEEAYARSIQLKKYNSRNLLFKKNQAALLEELYEIQERTDKIRSILYDDDDCIMEYFDLSLFMNRKLSEILITLTLKNKHYRHEIANFVLGFHNLHRAFLSDENPMKTTIDEALEYCGKYIEIDF